MAFQLIRHDEPLPSRNITIVIFGEPGVSKTSLSFTAENPVLWAFDAKGLDRAVNRKDAIRFDEYVDFLEYMDSNEIEKNGYKTGIFDTGGSFLDDYLAPYIVKLNEKYGNGMGGLGLSGYGVMKDTASKMFVKAEQKKIDLIFICHTETEKEGDNYIRKPKMTGGARDILIAKADLIGYMEMRNNKITLEFSPTSRHDGKNCARFPILEIPHFEKDPDKFNTYMAGIIRQTKEHMAKMDAAQVKAIKQVDEYKQRINGIDNIDQLEGMVAEIEALSPTYKVQVNQVFGKKYAELWGAINFKGEFKTPEQFEKLSEDMRKLSVPIRTELGESFRKLLDDAGLTWNKDLKKFIPKASTPSNSNAGAPPATPPQTPPASPPPAGDEKKEISAPPAAAAAKKTKKETKAPAPAVQEKVKQEESWFRERIGKTVMAKSTGKFNGPMQITDEKHADHLCQVSQNLQGYEFTDMEPAPTAVSAEAQGVTA